HSLVDFLGRIVHAIRTEQKSDIDQALAVLHQRFDGDSTNAVWLMWGTAMLGRVDEAYKFAVPDMDFDDELFVDSVFAPFRRDRRFVALFRHHFDFWRKTGKWPTFCADPLLPYDCKAEVARLTAQHT